MEQSTTLKLRISRMFQSSFGSCRTKNITDVVDQPFFFPENRHHRQLIDLFSPKPTYQSLPSLCRPDQKHFQRTSDRSTLRREPHPAETHTETPISPASFYEKPAGKRKTRKKKKKHSVAFESVTADYYKWCSSDDDEDDEDDETTLFSSKSLSSDSSGSFRRTQRHRGGGRRRRGGGCKDGRATEVMALERVRGKVKDSFAVVKKSSDPHNDFRTSMVEMIVEKQIFGGEELENLLQCFLSLNSHHHHQVIVQVFTEIWETLFSDDFS